VSTAALTRTCAIASRMGESVECPPGGCRLACQLGVMPTDSGPCPVEALAGDSPLAVAGLNELRRELERPAAYDHPLRREETRRRRHAAMIAG
jgi:hypothetical protein